MEQYAVDDCRIRRVCKWEAAGVAVGGGGGLSHQRAERVYLFISIHINIHIHPCIHTYIHIYTHSHTHAYIHTYIHTYMYACIHTHVHTYMYVAEALGSSEAAADEGSAANQRAMSMKSAYGKQGHAENIKCAHIAASVLVTQ